MQPRDNFLLKTIITFCDEISSAIETYSIDKERVANDSTMMAVLAFFVQQIGESASKLSKEFKESHPEIEWAAIVGMRHRIVHAYGKVFPDILWDTVQNDIPGLRNFCAGCVSE